MPEFTPIFDFGDTYPATIAIGDKTLPIKIKNLDEREFETFRAEWTLYVTPPRGSEDETPEQRAQRHTQQQDFYARTIREMVTVEEGLFRYRDAWVTDGAGLLRAFHARRDVLSPILAQIWLKNSLSDIEVKNSPSPRASAPSSAPSSPSRGGDAQGSTAASAERSSTAPNEAATGATPDSLSGEIPKIH